MKTKLICMSFDGEFQVERPEFDSVESAWEYSNDLGSKWYFYPFHFVVTASGKTIKDAPEMLRHFIGQRVKSVAAIFEAYSKTEEAKDMDAEKYAWSVAA